MDTIANFLTSLRNAEMAGHSQMTFPTSKAAVAVLTVLHKKGYVASFTSDSEAKKTTVVIKPSALPHVYRRISKPGRRLYVQADSIPTVRSGKGMVVLSTSHGVMSGPEARKLGVGGEIICEVY